MFAKLRGIQYDWIAVNESMKESGFRYAEFMGHVKDLGISFLGKWSVTKRVSQSIATEAFAGRARRGGAVTLSSCLILLIAKVRT